MIAALHPFHNFRLGRSADRFTWQRRTGGVILAGAFSLLVAAMVDAQMVLSLPEASQRAVVEQRISLTDVTITYHRPLVNGRKIWGGLVPYGDVWRAGSNENTTIEFSSAVTVEGKPLAKGTYGLHMIPTADSWTVIFSKANVSWGSYTYKEAEDALRVTVKPQPVEMHEALVYEFDELKPTSAIVALKWEKLAVPFAVAINDEETTLPNIRNQLRGIFQYSWESWFAAANFCLERKINLEEALKWADKSIQMESRFENLGLKANILKALNRGPEAAAAQTKALEVATGSQLYFYGRQLQNQKRGDEAIEVFRTVVKRFPQGVYGSLAKARVASSTGDFATALKEAKDAQAASPDDQQKAAIQALINRLEKKEDINK
jgi:tetratricopeptide (TPR) repeat protein